MVCTQISNRNDDIQQMTKNGSQLSCNDVVEHIWYSVNDVERITKTFSRINQNVGQKEIVQQNEG